MKHVIELIRTFIGDESMNPQHKAEIVDNFVNVCRVAVWLGGIAAILWALDLPTILPLLLG